MNQNGKRFLMGDCNRDAKERFMFNRDNSKASPAPRAASESRRPEANIKPGPAWGPPTGAALPRAGQAHGSLNGADVLQLQRTLGNRATVQLLQNGAAAADKGPSAERAAPAETVAADTEAKAESADGKREPLASETFEAGDESHRLWAYEADGKLVVMVASTPMTIQQRLRKWEKEAAKMKDSKLKANTLDWIGKTWGKLHELTAASSTDNPKERSHAVHEASANLREMIKKLFWVFSIDLPELGAVAVYRGLHFSKDWESKRGRTVADESGRSFESVASEGSYSSAAWELAKQLAGDSQIGKPHLEKANEIIQNVLSNWKETTDFNREDTSDQGKKTRNLRLGIAHHQEQNNQEQARVLEEALENKKSGFTQGGNKFGNQFLAALSRYIDRQSLFETELAKGSDGGYKDVPFKQIPFISTSKSAGEAVKYAQGKLASDDNRSTSGVVGRVLVYVAHRIELLEAGGIDVWQELGEGKLRFTEWRMNENEITFSGKIPDHFLRAMSPVNGGETVEDGANRAEIEAAKAAAPFGGLKPLPTNKPKD